MLENSPARSSAGCVLGSSELLLAISLTLNYDRVIT